MQFSANQELPEPPRLSGNPGNDARIIGQYLMQLRGALQVAYENIYSDIDSGAARLTIHTSADGAGAYPALSNTDEGQLKLYLSTNPTSGYLFTRMNDTMFVVPMAGL